MKISQNIKTNTNCSLKIEGVSQSKWVNGLGFNDDEILINMFSFYSIFSKFIETLKHYWWWKKHIYYYYYYLVTLFHENYSAKEIYRFVVCHTILNFLLWQRCILFSSDFCCSSFELKTVLIFKPVLFFSNSHNVQFNNEKIIEILQVFEDIFH